MRLTANLTAAALLVAEGLAKYKVCFDMEVGRDDWAGRDDEINEDTSCQVAAWFSGGRKTWMSGIKNDAWGNCERIYDYHSSRDLYLQTHCGDGMWLDRLMISDGWTYIKEWGASNNQGWCVSTEKSDWDKFGGGKVPTRTCYYMLKFTPSGQVWGWKARHRRLSAGDEDEDGVWELLDTGAQTEAETSPSLDNDESDGVWELIEDESSPSLDDDQVEEPSLTRRLERALGLKLAELQAPPPQEQEAEARGE